MKPTNLKTVKLTIPLPGDMDIRLYTLAKCKRETKTELVLRFIAQGLDRNKVPAPDLADGAAA